MFSELGNILIAYNSVNFKDRKSYDTAMESYDQGLQLVLQTGRVHCVLGYVMVPKLQITVNFVLRRFNAAKACIIFDAAAYARI